MRDELRDLLLDGDDDAIRRFAREAVSSLGRTDSPAGRQSFFAYRVLRALSPETLIASLLAAMMGDQERGGLAEKVARQTIADRIKAFEEAVESEVRRRLAETKGVESVTRSAVKPLTDQVDFLRASRNDLIELRRQVQPLARRLATRLTAKRRLGRTGKLDFRRTVRASLATGGVPLETKHKPHKPHKPELVVLLRRLGLGELVRALHADADARAARAVLQGAGVRVHRHLRRGHRLPARGRHRRRDGADRARTPIWSGSTATATTGTRSRSSPSGTPTRSPRRRRCWCSATRVTTTARPPRPTVRRLVKEARHSYWLNPEPRTYWGSGDSATKTVRAARSTRWSSAATSSSSRSSSAAAADLSRGFARSSHRRVPRLAMTGPLTRFDVPFASFRRFQMLLNRPGSRELGTFVERFSRAATTGAHPFHPWADLSRAAVPHKGVTGWPAE